MARSAVTIDHPTLTPEQEQEKWLGEALRNAREKAAFMRAAMAQRNFVGTLRAASQMLAELRTGMLSPQNYYELYVKIFDELQRLETYLMDEAKSGRSIEDIYEVVQHAGNIVPRLYMLFAAGSVYIKLKRAPCRELLRDMVEMCKGVQHPTRGLFLRNYLLTLTKNILPDAGNEYDGEGGSVDDSVAFVLQNFKEMLWLWVRMEKLEHISRARRERERKELRILVGFNLVRLSQLDGVTRKIYQETVLPNILHIILKFKEPMAQQYLLEIIIHVFPDEFHLMTLQELLQSFSTVVSGVDIPAVFISLMDRLGNYVTSLRDGTAEGTKKEEKVIRNMFSVFQQQIAQLTQQGVFSAAAFAETNTSLLKLVLKTYPGEFDRVNEILEGIKTQFVSTKLTEPAFKAVKKLVEHLADSSKDINSILDLTALDGVVDTLSFKTRREIALLLCNMAVSAGTKITSLERVAKLFDILSPIVKESLEDATQVYTSPEEEFHEEQNLVCRVLHLIDSDDLSLLMKIYSGMRKQLAQGAPPRQRITLKAVASLYARLAIRIKKAQAAGQEPGVQPSKCFQYVYAGDGKGIVEILVRDDPLPSFYTLLTCANAADYCDLEAVSYELYAQAFIIYEEQGGDSKDQLMMLNSIISSLCALRTMSEESYDTLATKVCQYSSKLLKKQDQCRMAALCSHLFWKKVLSEPYHKKVLECMQRALKISDNVPAAQQMSIYVDLLNHFLYYFAANTTGFTVKYISTLMDLYAACEKAADSGEVDVESSLREQSKQYFRNTKRFIISRQQVDDAWKEISV